MIRPYHCCNTEAVSQGSVVQGIIPWPDEVQAEVEAKFRNCPSLLRGLPVVAKVVDITARYFEIDYTRDMKLANRERNAHLMNEQFISANLMNEQFIRLGTRVKGCLGAIAGGVIVVGGLAVHKRRRWLCKQEVIKAKEDACPKAAAAAPPSSACWADHCGDSANIQGDGYALLKVVRPSSPVGLQMPPRLPSTKLDESCQGSTAISNSTTAATPPADPPSASATIRLMPQALSPRPPPSFIRRTISVRDAVEGLSPQDLAACFEYTNFTLIAATLKSCDFGHWLESEQCFQLGAGAQGFVVQGIIPWPDEVQAEVEAKFRNCPSLLRGLPVVAKVVDITARYFEIDFKRDMKLATRERNALLLSYGRDLYVNIKQKVATFDSSVLVPRLLTAEWLPPEGNDPEEYSQYVMIFQTTTGRPFPLNKAIEMKAFQCNYLNVISLTWCLKKQLGHSHLRNLVHRDVKPQNVVVGDSTMCLVDWGLAGSVGEQAGMLVGYVVAGGNEDLFAQVCVVDRWVQHSAAKGQSTGAFPAQHMLRVVLRRCLGATAGVLDVLCCLLGPSSSWPQSDEAWAAMFEAALIKGAEPDLAVPGEVEWVVACEEELGRQRGLLKQDEFRFNHDVGGGRWTWRAASMAGDITDDEQVYDLMDMLELCGVAISI
eukprot:gene9510-9674_t